MTSAAGAPSPLHKSLYVQVLAAIAAGILLGHFMPDLGTQMKPLGDGFIKLIKMIIAPIVGIVAAFTHDECYDELRDDW